MDQVSLPVPTRYDQVARYLIHKSGLNFFTWVLGLTPEEVNFERWRSPQLTLPGATQRLCDGIAYLTDPRSGGVPYLALLEIQLRPDHTMPGRLMLAAGLAWLTLRPSDIRGDRYQLVAIVLNLTGVGDAAQQFDLGSSHWAVRPAEVNFEAQPADEILERIAQQEIPWQMLAFVPLMQSNDEPAIIRRWRELVLARDSPEERGDCALALVFAEHKGRRQTWEDAMSDITFIEAPIIGELLEKTRAEAEARGEARGKSEGRTEGEILGKRDNLLRLLAKRRWAVPAEVTQVIQGCTDASKLDAWFDAAVDAADLEQFRQNAGL